MPAWRRGFMNWAARVQVRGSFCLEDEIPLGHLGHFGVFRAEFCARREPSDHMGASS